MRLENLPAPELSGIHAMICRYLLSKGVARETAEDITQDVIVKNLGREIQHPGFLIVSAWHKYLDWIKKKENQADSLETINEAGTDFSNPNERSPFQQLEDKDRAAIGMAEAKLHCRFKPPCSSHCNLIVWIDVEEQPLREVAERTGKPIETVRRWHEECKEHFRSGAGA